MKQLPSRGSPVIPEYIGGIRRCVVAGVRGRFSPHSGEACAVQLAAGADQILYLGEGNTQQLVALDPGQGVQLADHRFPQLAAGVIVTITPARPIVIREGMPCAHTHAAVGVRLGGN